jgi:hypothetical protein
VVAALAFSFAPRLVSPFLTDHPAMGAGPSEQVAGATLVDAAPVVARIDQRDNTIDRVLKHRLLLVAVMAALVSLPSLVRRVSRAADRGERTATAAPSPFCGRAPPRLTARCA